MTLIVENIYSASRHQPILDQGTSQGTSRGKGLSNKEQKARCLGRERTIIPPKKETLQIRDLSRPQETGEVII